jgi:hypothetical protein
VKGDGASLGGSDDAEGMGNGCLTAETIEDETKGFGTDSGAPLPTELCKLIPEAPPNPVDAPNVGVTVVSTDLGTKLDPNGLLLLAPLLLLVPNDKDGSALVAVNGLAAELKEEEGIAVYPNLVLGVGFAEEPEGNKVLLPNPN